MRNRELDIDDPMPFGKYKGLRIMDVARDDYRYLMWAYENVNSFDLSEDALQWLSALEKNVSRSQSYK